MQTVIKVTVHNMSFYQNYLKGGDMVLDLDNFGNLILNPPNSASSTQVWQLIPNVVIGGPAGYTLYNPGETGGCAYFKANGVQITINDDPTPYGGDNYNWVMTPVGTINNYPIVNIQDNSGLYVMGAQGIVSQGSPIIPQTNTGDLVQQWVIIKLPDSITT